MEKVEARLAALELAVTELRKQLEHERTRIRTMRQTQKCPACGGNRILHFRRIDALNNGAPVRLWRKQRWFRSEQVDGLLELFACRACGFIEWQTPPLDRVTADGTDVIELVPEEPAASEHDPYR